MLVAALFLHRPSHYDTDRRWANTLKCGVPTFCGTLCCIHIKSYNLFNFEIEITIMANWPARLLPSD